ncbi:hypothetical protein NESM_000254400 [Novymonas esmeraldas]|uniref:Uncharacterized protein n=1 Tax=Novymonas esmeraldas TaxID=1808958 RepID=A0AAW0F6J9_9TRYP
MPSPAHKKSHAAAAAAVQAPHSSVKQRSGTTTAASRRAMLLRLATHEADTAAALLRLMPPSSPAAPSSAVPTATSRAAPPAEPHARGGVSVESRSESVPYASLWRQLLAHLPQRDSDGTATPAPRGVARDGATVATVAAVSRNATSLGSLGDDWRRFFFCRRPYVSSDPPQPAVAACASTMTVAEQRAALRYCASGATGHSRALCVLNYI